MIKVARGDELTPEKLETFELANKLERRQI
jgi:hypothetical protein